MQSCNITGKKPGMAPGIKDTLDRTLVVQMKKLYKHHGSVKLIFICDVYCQDISKRSHYLTESNCQKQM